MAIDPGDADCTSGLSGDIYWYLTHDKPRNGFVDPLTESAKDAVRAICWAMARGVADFADGGEPGSDAWEQEQFTGAGLSVFTLARTAKSKSAFCFRSKIPELDAVVSGSTVTLASPLGPDDDLVVRYQWGVAPP